MLHSMFKRNTGGLDKHKNVDIVGASLKNGGKEMMLLTEELRKNLPALYTTEKKKPEDTPVIVKFFDPCGSWTWYATEFDGKDIFFGFVRGIENELGYFSLAELQAYKGKPFGLGIERDMYFGKHTLAEAMEERL